MSHSSFYYSEEELVKVNTYHMQDLFYMRNILYALLMLLGIHVSFHPTLLMAVHAVYFYMLPPLRTLF
jgi:hypothetical protein